MDYQTFNLLFRYSKEFSHERIRLQKLSDTECMLCSYIFSHENCSQDDVSAALKVDKTTVGKALAALEKRNFVVRLRDETDKRIKRLSLTDTGRRRVSALIDLHNDWLRKIMACLSSEEQKHFEDYCERLLTAAESLTDKNSP